MSNVFQGQSSLRLRVTVSRNLSDAQECLIKYLKPDGTDGSWAADIESVENGIIYYDLSDDELDQVGWWTVWAHVTFTDARSAPGDGVKLHVFAEGSVPT